MALQLKRSLTSEIEPGYVLLSGQIGIEMPTSKNTWTNSFKFKIGDGQTAWQYLPYAGISDNTQIGSLVFRYSRDDEVLNIAVEKIM